MLFRLQEQKYPFEPLKMPKLRNVTTYFQAFSAEYFDSLLRSVKLDKLEVERKHILTGNTSINSVYV